MQWKKESRLKVDTYAEFEDHNDSENGPNGVSTNVLKGLFEENQKRKENESESHFGGEYDLPGIRHPHLPRSRRHALRALPRADDPVGDSAVGAASPGRPVVLLVGLRQRDPNLGVTPALHGEQPLLLLGEAVTEGAQLGHPRRRTHHRRRMKGNEILRRLSKSERDFGDDRKVKKCFGNVAVRECCGS